MYAPIMFCCMHTITEYFQEKINSILLTGTIWIGLMFMSLWTHSSYSKKVFPWALHFYSCSFIVYTINFPFVGHSFIFYGACMLFLFYSMIFLWNHYDYFHLIDNGLFHPFILNQPNQNILIQVNQQQTTTIQRTPPLQQIPNLDFDLRRRRNFNDENDTFIDGENVD